MTPAQNPQKSRAAFLDRDGVLNRAIVRDGRPYAPRSLLDFVLLPDAPEAVARLKRAGYLTIVVTNQKDVGAGLVTMDLVESMHRVLRAAMPIDDIRVCTCVDECPCYKPNPGMLVDAAKDWNVDLSTSVMIGDRWRDVDAGRNAGCRTILIDRGYSEGLRSAPDLTVANIADAVERLLA